MIIENGDLASCVERYLSTAVADRPTLVDEVFAPGAVVHDEGHTYVGIEAIRKWTIDLAERFTFDAELEQVARDGNRISADVIYTGDFPGSPVRVTSHFTLEGELISEIDNRS
jgi:SnoaL-like domain